MAVLHRFYCISILVATAYAQTCQNLRCSHTHSGDVDEGNDNYDTKVDILVMITLGKSSDFFNLILAI